MKRFLAVHASLAYLFLYLPLAVLAVFSVNASKIAVWSGFTFEWYRQALLDPSLLEGAKNSVVIALATTAFATAAGTLGAYALWKRRSSWLMISLYLSLVTPEIVTGVSLLAFFQMLFRFLHVQLGFHTVILAHVSFSLVFVVIVMLARLRAFDVSLEEAASDLGATEWQTFWRVSMPLLLPGIVAAALLCFTVSFDDYVITSLVAGVDSETLPMKIYGMARRGVSPEVNAISVLITVGIGMIILLAGRFERSRSAEEK